MKTSVVCFRLRNNYCSLCFCSYNRFFKIYITLTSRGKEKKLSFKSEFCLVAGAELQTEVEWDFRVVYKNYILLKSCPGISYPAVSVNCLRIFRHHERKILLTTLIFLFNTYFHRHLHQIFAKLRFFLSISIISITVRPVLICAAITYWFFGP